jgi:hypothetical protein
MATMNSVHTHEVAILNEDKEPVAMTRAVFGWGEAVRFFFERETLGLRKCGFHQNSTPASAISTRYRVGLGGVAFVPPGAICALLSGAGAV